jgi:hypothetical protein
MGGSGGEIRGDPAALILSRKASLPLMQERPYRKPTLVGRGESPQVIEKTFVKELGKLTP